jgi:thiamine-phosphate diphosphorylase
MLIQNMRSRICFVVVDEGGQSLRLRALVGAALRAGVGMVEYRASERTTRQMTEEAAALGRMTRAARVPLVINDRTDIALAVGADGVHLGAEDMPVAYARRMMGPGAIIGATVLTPREARVMECDGATYVAVGPVYAARERTPGIVLGPDHVQVIRQATTLPVCAFGGIDGQRAAELASQGVELLAISTAIQDSDDAFPAAQALVRAVATFPDPARHVAL